MQVTDEDIRRAIEELLNKRLPSATVCPSEAARVLAPQAWRPLMSQVRSVAVSMAKDGALNITQGGAAVELDQPLSGPIRLGRPRMDSTEHPTTPDGRYFVVRGRLWRKANPGLPEDVRRAWVKQLMDARRALRGRVSDEVRQAAREQVDVSKQALGERGPVWWTDGAPDFNRKLAKNTPYRDWFVGLVE